MPKLKLLEPHRLYIREWRESLGLTQGQLALEVGVDRSVVSRWERPGVGGRGGMSVGAQFCIAEALGVEPQDLFRHPDSPSLDAALRGVSDDTRAMAWDVVQAIIGHASRR